MASWNAFRRLTEMRENYYNWKICFFFFQGGPSNNPYLQQVSLHIINDYECNDDYAAYGGITDTMICAGDPNGGKGACSVIWS